MTPELLDAFITFLGAAALVLPAMALMFRAVARLLERLGQRLEHNTAVTQDTNSRVEAITQATTNQLLSDRNARLLTLLDVIADDDEHPDCGACRDCRRAMADKIRIAVRQTGETGEHLAMRQTDGAS